MAGGSVRHIEDIEPGDFVRGRYGEVNAVLALDRPPLGNRALYPINKRRLTAGGHTHFTAAGPKVVCPENAENQWGMSHPVILASGRVIERFFVGSLSPAKP